MERMSEERYPKKMYQGHPEGVRRRGRPRLRWRDDVDEELRELGFGGWRVRAKDRKE